MLKKFMKWKEDEILDEVVMEDKSTKKEPDFSDAGSNSSPTAKSDSSEKLTTQQGTADKKSCNTLKLTYDSLTKHVRKRKTHNFLRDQTNSVAKLPVKSIMVWSL